MTAGEEVTVVEVAVRTAACCAAVTVATAVEPVATCEMEDIHDRYSAQGAFRLVPFLVVPCLGAYQYSEGDGASGRVALVCAAEP